jgi:hypothetical protein
VVTRRAPSTSSPGQSELRGNRIHWLARHEKINDVVQPGATSRESGTAERMIRANSHIGHAVLREMNDLRIIIGSKSTRRRYSHTRSQAPSVYRRLLANERHSSFMSARWPNRRNDWPGHDDTVARPAAFVPIGPGRERGRRDSQSRRKQSRIVAVGLSPQFLPGALPQEGRLCRARSPVAQ